MKEQSVPLTQPKINESSNVDQTLALEQYVVILPK